MRRRDQAIEEEIEPVVGAGHRVDDGFDGRQIEARLVDVEYQPLAGGRHGDDGDGEGVGVSARWVSGRRSVGSVGT